MVNIYYILKMKKKLWIKYNRKMTDIDKGSDAEQKVVIEPIHQQDEILRHGRPLGWWGDKM